LELVLLGVFAAGVLLQGTLIARWKKFSAVDFSYIVPSIRVFFTGLTMSSLVLKTGKREYKRLAKQSTMEMKKLMRNKEINNLRRYILMEACLSALKKYSPGSSLPNAASCVKLGLRKAQDKEGSVQLAGEYFLTTDEDDWCTSYFTRGGRDGKGETFAAN
jgi:hypothetical protein